MRKIKTFVVIILSAFLCNSSQAEFIISSAIIEFTSDGPRQQDIELISRSAADNEYIQVDVNKVLDAGTDNERKQLVTDPARSLLLVTPNKTILGKGGRKVLRFVLLKDPDEQEHIYRVEVKPIIGGVDNQSKLGLKILVGYEVLVIIRPKNISNNYTAHRKGRQFIVTNNGNSNILFQNGVQCSTENDCKPVPVLRVYPGKSGKIELPKDIKVKYSVWDGLQTVEKEF